ncbi:nucleotide exchange factor GrpE [Candidatus Gracilibacteria bacterium]|nr:MAG: nucleotide exchange factor GrpE [Candidatus Gracilibacteria bacterium]
MTQDNTTPEQEEHLDEVSTDETDAQNQDSNQDIEALQQKVSMLEESLARKQADYQNLQMRSERERTEMIHFLSEKMLTPLLTQIDHLERAIQTQEGVEGDTFVDGVRSTYDGFVKYLDSQNVKAFDSVGQEIDPDKHDVLSQMPGKEGFVVQEFEKGYMLGDRVLRHAKVIAGNGED